MDCFIAGCFGSCRYFCSISVGGETCASVLKDHQNLIAASIGLILARSFDRMVTKCCALLPRNIRGVVARWNGTPKTPSTSLN